MTPAEISREQDEANRSSQSSEESRSEPWDHGPPESSHKTSQDIGQEDPQAWNPTPEPGFMDCHLDDGIILPGKEGPLKSNAVPLSS